MIVRENVVLNTAVDDDSDWRFDNLINAVVIFRVKVSCITSVDDTKLWFC